MDFSRLIDIANQADEFIKTMNETKEKYSNKINGYIKDLEDLKNKNSVNSTHYIQYKTKTTKENINKVLKTFNKKISDDIEELKIWYDNQMLSIKIQIVKYQQAKLGIVISDSAAKALAENIPHPELSIPEFKINVPEIE